MQTYLVYRLFKQALLIAMPVLVAAGFTGCKKATETVELTFASWRIDDTEEMDRVNAVFTEAHPDITIRFVPYDPNLYEGITISHLSQGEGDDIIFLWSYDKGYALHEAGYLYDLTEIIPNLPAYDPVPLKAWTTDEGITYGVPSVGVTHGVYYNKPMFEQYQISEPVTWDEFIAACEKLLQAGETVIAQGTADNSWIWSRIIFGGLGPNFYGGEAARQGLMAGTMRLTDENFLEAFRMVYSLKKYLPADFTTLGYEEAKVRFASGEAAMFIGGSWEISVFESLGATSSTMGWFAPPVKKAGDRLQYCFHVDAGIGMNKDSRNPDATLEYIKWTAGMEYAQAIMSELPGFFSYTPGAPAPDHSLARKMFNAAATADLTVRLMYEKLNSTSPGGDALLAEALEGMVLGTFTPETAAAYVQERLSD